MHYKLFFIDTITYCGKTYSDNVKLKLCEMEQTSKVSIKLKESWDSLMLNLSYPKCSEKIFEDLMSRYTENHRVFHDICRISEMLDEYESFENNSGLFIERNHLNKLAIWFQSIAFNPNSCNYERASAHFAYSLVIRMGLHPNEASYVCAVIAATSHNSDLVRHPGKIVADVDLAYLAKPNDEFLADIDSMRREYIGHFNAHQLKIRQGNFFRPILDRKSIYYTPYFKEKYEGAARLNVEWLLQ